MNSRSEPMHNRRRFLHGSSALSLSLLLGERFAASGAEPMPLQRIQRSEMPMLLETPLAALDRPVTPNDLFYLAVKFTGRLIAWFESDLMAINIQVVPDPQPARKRRRKGR